MRLPIGLKNRLGAQTPQFTAARKASRLLETLLPNTPMALLSTRCPLCGSPTKFLHYVEASHGRPPKGFNVPTLYWYPSEDCTAWVRSKVEKKLDTPEQTIHGFYVLGVG